MDDRPVTIDAHHHIWSLGNGWYDWLTPELGPIHRDYSLSDLSSELASSGVTGTVLVQAAGHVEETRFMIASARGGDLVKGIVGWADLESRSGLAAIEEFAQEPLIKGFRPLIQDIPDVGWMLRPTLAPALGLLQRLGLSFDALVTPAHLDALPLFVDRYPGLAVVIDHGAKPAIRDGRRGFDAWAPKMTRLARREHVHCKLSGLLTEAGPGASAEHLKPFVDHLLGIFGPDRLMWGSDWPVLERAGDYASWLRLARSLTAHLGEGERAALFGTTAQRFYRL